MIIYKFVGITRCMSVNIDGMGGEVPFQNFDETIKFVSLDLFEGSRKAAV